MHDLSWVYNLKHHQCFMTHKPNKRNKESQHFYIPIPIRNQFKKNPHNASVSFVRNIKTLFVSARSARYYAIEFVCGWVRACVKHSVD